MSGGMFPFFLFLLALVLVLIILALRSLLLIRKRMTGTDASGGAKQQPMEFVVGTFQELVAKLKEKERELEELRNRAEQRANHYESYSENILQSVPSGMITFDVEGRIIMVNRAAENILGFQSGELLGRTASAVGDAMEQMLQEPPAGRREVAYTARDGRRLWLGLFISDLLDREGKNLGRILGFTDLTEIRRLREKVELRERLTHLGEVSAGIAHEIRNPMAVIAGYAQMLDARGELDEGARQAVQHIRKEIDGINRVIGEFLQFARPTEPNMESLDLGEVLAEALDLSDHEGCHVETRSDIPDGIRVRGDGILLRQCFQNLMKNACEAMAGGGQLGLRVVENGNRVRVEISDTGPGISEEVRDRIFLPFVTSRDEGTGLGLAIVQKIVVLHEGAIEVESGETGTVFKVTLPMVREEGDR